MSFDEQAEAAIRDFRIRNPGYLDIPIQQVHSGYAVRNMTTTLQRIAYKCMGIALDIRSVHSHSEAALVLRIRRSNG